MIKRIKIFILIFFVFFDLTKAQNACAWINKIQGYQNSIKVNFESKSPSLDSTFNLTNYLSLFDKIIMPPDLESRVYYGDFGLGGAPIIYTVPKDYNLTDSIEKKINKRRKLLWIRGMEDTAELKRYLLSSYAVDSTHRAFMKMIPEKSDAGFFQYLFFYIMGEQFALYWHSNYDETKIICSKENIENMIKEYNNTDLFEVDNKELGQLIEIDPSYIITTTQTKYIITWYELETHNGLYKRTYEIDREPPYRIHLIKSDKLLTIGLNFLY